MSWVQIPSPAPSAFANGFGGTGSRAGCLKYSAGGGCHAEALAKADWPGMTSVYILQSEADETRYYVGISNDPARRLEEHNNGKSIHTNKHRPWKVVVSIGFADPAKAAEFERYLKSGSGRAFAKKHF
jgi:putative endonuclease